MEWFWRDFAKIQIGFTKSQRALWFRICICDLAKITKLTHFVILAAWFSHIVPFAPNWNWGSEQLIHGGEGVNKFPPTTQWAFEWESWTKCQKWNITIDNLSKFTSTFSHKLNVQHELWPAIQLIHWWSVVSSSLALILFL